VKAVLVYDQPFWDTQKDFIGCLRTPRSGDLRVQDTYERDRGKFYLIWNCTPSCGKPTLGISDDVPISNSSGTYGGGSSIAN
jgi:hypothetical protein